MTSGCLGFGRGTFLDAPFHRDGREVTSRYWLMPVFTPFDGTAVVSASSGCHRLFQQRDMRKIADLAHPVGRIGIAHLLLTVTGLEAATDLSFRARRCPARPCRRQWDIGLGPLGNRHVRAVDPDRISGYHRRLRRWMARSALIDPHHFARLCCGDRRNRSGYRIQNVRMPRAFKLQADELPVRHADFLLHPPPQLSEIEIGYALR